ncbi:hypothetical protein MTR67_050010, partial [Solanum verrucosum]
GFKPIRTLIHSPLSLSSSLVRSLIAGNSYFEKKWPSRRITQLIISPTKHTGMESRNPESIVTVPPKGSVIKPNFSPFCAYFREIVELFGYVMLRLFNLMNVCMCEQFLKQNMFVILSSNTAMM